MTMSGIGGMSGVERYITELVDGLMQFRDVKIALIQFLNDKSQIFIRKQKLDGYTKITVPLPVAINEIISNPYWMQRYCRNVYHLLEDEFKNKQNCILHLNTLNLMDFALYVKSKIECKIVSHIHCIPWKGLYNLNKHRFNYLYNKYYILQDYTCREEFIHRNYEVDTYCRSDAIVCVTNCAREFIKHFYKTNLPIYVISNGIQDQYKDTKTIINNNSISCIYVGNMSESKGLSFILETLDTVRKQGFNVTLRIAGKCLGTKKSELEIQYPLLDIHFLGEIPLAELCIYYKSSDIGLIASLQEQCSYAAIEMMMNALPVVVTDVDGLSEMFVDNYNALKTNVKFSPILGLKVDTKQMSENIIKLIKDYKLRKKLGNHSRIRYLTFFSLDKMILATYKMYHKVLNI